MLLEMRTVARKFNIAAANPLLAEKLSAPSGQHANHVGSGVGNGVSNGVGNGVGNGYANRQVATLGNNNVKVEGRNYDFFFI